MPWKLKNPDLTNDPRYLEPRITKLDEDLAEKAKQSDLNITNSTVALKADKTYVDSNISTLDSKINSQASGSPKGTYATVSALQTAFPTGNTNTYVVTADGNWYYWNDTAWTAGGIYQATGVADSSITSQKLSSEVTNSLNVAEEFRSFKEEVIIYGKTPVVETTYQNVRQKTPSGYDTYTFITSHANKVDHTVLNDFNRLKLSFRPLSGATINGTLKVFVNDRATPSTSENVIALGSTTVINMLASTEFLIELDRIVDTSSIVNGLIVGYYVENADGTRPAIRFDTGTEGIVSNLVTYYGQNTSDPTSVNSGGRIMYLDFGLESETGEFVTTSEIGELFPDIPKEKITGLTDSAETLTINLPDKLDVVVGDTVEVFYRSIVGAVNPFNYNILFRTSKGNVHKNRWIYTPQSGDTNFTVVVEVYDNQNNLIVSKSTSISILPVKTSPSTVKNILCIGDSLTANGKWVTELRRRLVGTGGTPAGLGLTNINFVGSKGTSPNNYEATPGWAFSNYVNNTGTNPFWNTTTGKIDFIDYCTRNSIASIDICYILLGWNELGVKAFTTAEHSTTEANAKKLIDQLHIDFPNCKVVLIGLQPPAPTGQGLSTGGTDNNNYYFRLLSTFGKNELYQKMVKETTYSSFVDFVHMGSQFDADNNYDTATRQVNLRNSLTETYQTNDIHPSTNGSYQIADAVYRNIMSKF